jgi:hypothetical protein
VGVAMGGEKYTWYILRQSVEQESYNMELGIT